MSQWAVINQLISNWLSCLERRKGKVESVSTSVILLLIGLGTTACVLGLVLSPSSSSALVEHLFEELELGGCWEDEEEEDCCY